MKKTLFMSLLAVTLVSGQAFGYTPTKVEGNETGNVVVTQSSSGTDWSYMDVYGTSSWQAQPTVVSNAHVNMTGGEVNAIYAGYAFNGSANNNTIEVTGGITNGEIVGGTSSYDGNANENTVIIKGGEIRSSIRGGYRENKTTTSIYEASRNKVIISGGTFDTRFDVFGGESLYGNGNTLDNQVHLVGSKGVATIDGETYVGQTGGLTLGLVAGGYSLTGTSTGNSVDLYGEKIKATQLWDGTVQQLNFHMVDAGDVVLTLTDKKCNLDLGDVILTFDFSKPIAMGSEITLIQSAGGITMSESQLNETWSVMSDSGSTTMAKLSLSDDKKTLKLTTIAAPEPATATLSLLALAGLASRRRRK